MSTAVKITEDDGEYTAIDAESGTEGRGPSKSAALLSLALALALSEGESSDETDTQALLTRLAERTQRRFESESVTEDDVEAAIAWARSE